MAGGYDSIGKTTDALAYQVRRLQRIRVGWADPSERQKIHKEIDRLAHKIINENEYIEALKTLHEQRAKKTTAFIGV
mgnify:FL=1